MARRYVAAFFLLFALSQADSATAWEWKSKFGTEYASVNELLTEEVGPYRFMNDDTVFRFSEDGTFQAVVLVPFVDKKFEMRKYFRVVFSGEWSAKQRPFTPEELKTLAVVGADKSAKPWILTLQYKEKVSEHPTEGYVVKHEDKCVYVLDEETLYTKDGEFRKSSPAFMFWKMIYAHRNGVVGVTQKELKGIFAMSRLE